MTADSALDAIERLLDAAHDGPSRPADALPARPGSWCQACGRPLDQYDHRDDPVFLSGGASVCQDCADIFDKASA